MKLKHSWISFSICGLIIVLVGLIQNSALRFSEQIKQIHPATSFIIALSGTVFILVIAKFSKENLREFKLNKNVLLGLLGILSGILVISNSINMIGYYLNTESLGIILASSLLGIASGPIFIIMGICSIMGRNMFKKIKFFSLIPTIWMISRLFTIFFKYNSTTNDFWSMSNEPFCIFLLLFLFNHAKIFAGLEYNRKKILAYGLCAFLFSIVYNEKLIWEIINMPSYFTELDYISVATDIFLSLYVILFILNSEISSHLGQTTKKTYKSDYISNPGQNDKMNEVVEKTLEEDSLQENITEINQFIEKLNSDL